MITETRIINDSEKLGRLRIKSTVLINKITTLTQNFFISHSRDVTETEWSNLIDQIMDVVETQRD